MSLKNFGTMPSIFMEQDKLENTLPKKLVVAAIIYRKNPKNEIEIFAIKRNHGEFKGFWEFAGGKIEKYETAKDALLREISEELSASIKIEKLFANVEYDYPNFHLSLQCFLCQFQNEKFSLNEHAEYKWLTVKKLQDIKWLPADKSIIQKLQSYFK